jgi:DNA polymerase bacteriophage-type
LAKKFVVCDLSSIETRGTGWIASCPGIMNVFENGLDAYVDFAARMLRKPYDECDPDFPGISKEEKAARKKTRQDYKPPVLGCGYGLGGGKEAVDKHGDDIKTGLWGYSENMGILLEQAFCQSAVDFYRTEYPEVPQAWRSLENAAIRAVQTGERQFANRCTFDCVKPGRLLYITLPSGRRLHYIRPRLDATERWDGDAYVKLSYEGNIIGNHWGKVWTWGGKLMENIVQAMSRDLLATGMLNAKAAGFTIVGHAHDEIIALEDANGPLGLEQLRECMIRQPSWALDLPLDADGFEDDKYRKG